MNKTIKNLNVDWSLFTAQFLYEAGIRYVCISPGARNSPLTYAFTNNNKIKCFSHVDERSSAYFALGIAKSTGSPVVIISTSGTAVANFYPAVIEASLSCSSILILSADRPDFLIGTGANQTIDQKHIYGNYVRYFKDVGLPSNQFIQLSEILKNSFVKLNGSDFIYPPGPVHLNYQFDEPLLQDNLNEKVDFTSIDVKKSKIKSVFKIPILKESHHPIIVAGPMNLSSFQKDIIIFAEKMNIPILADPLSQLRYGYDSDLILSNYDIFLRHVKINPDRIIRFGKKPTSKILCQLLSEYKDKTLLVDPWNQFNDDSSQFIQSAIDQFCNKQMNQSSLQGSKNWVKKLISYEDLINKELELNKTFHEGSIARECVQSIGEKGHFIIGNSMPIRDVDMFSSTSNKKLYTYSNRGASGIDGVVSTALGISANKKSNSLLLIGDLSFYHDMNGLLASRFGYNLTIVVINNGGGGIFSFLPIAELELNQFDEYWTTNTELNIEKIADLYNCCYYFSDNLKSLKKNILDSFNVSGTKIIEIKTSVSENVISHQQFINETKKLISI